MGTRLTLKTPADYLFKRDVCSYGYFHLAPNIWTPALQTLTRPLRLEAGVATFTLSQPNDAPGSPIRADVDRTLSRSEQTRARQLLTRMLRLDDDIAEFHRVDKRWKRSGKGRIFRSPTFFEDLVKTITSCNVTWPGTVTMNRRLCEVLDVAFPTPDRLARCRPQTLRSRCGVGYRDQRLIAIAKLVRSGSVDPDWFENPHTPDEEVHKALLALPGVGPYAAGNMMQLLGRYSFLAIDTESIKHGKTVLSFTGSDRTIEKKLRAHYEQFGAHRFRSYWFEMWDRYEKKEGPAWTWPQRSPDAARAKRKRQRA